MHIKRFEATSMAEAIRQVKQELGPEAVILSSRPLRRRSRWLGTLQRSGVEVTAAVDRDLAAAPETGARRRADPSWQSLQVTRALLEPLEEELRELRALVQESAARRAPAGLAAELEELRRIARRLEGAGPPAPPASAEACFLRAGIARPHAKALAEASEARVAEGCEPGPAMLDALARRLEERLAAPRILDAASQLTVGANGVGKTTTLAKLADRQASGTRLLSADVERVGGSVTLKEAARALGLPFQEVVSPEALADAVRGDAGPVLVDTPGCPTGNHAALGRLAALRRALGTRGQVQVAVSATTKESDLRAQLGFYRLLQPDGLVLTRLDESVDLGNVVNLLLEPDTPPLSWIGCGPAIPEDLQVPDAALLARRALAGALP